MERSRNDVKYYRRVISTCLMDCDSVAGEETASAPRTNLRSPWTRHSRYDIPSYLDEESDVHSLQSYSDPSMIWTRREIDLRTSQLVRGPN